MSEVMSRDVIQRQAERAAEKGDGPESCPYMAGSEFERHWKDAYYVRVYQLSGEETA